MCSFLRLCFLNYFKMTQSTAERKNKINPQRKEKLKSIHRGKKKLNQRLHISFFSSLIFFLLDKHQSTVFSTFCFANSCIVELNIRFLAMNVRHMDSHNIKESFYWLVSYDSSPLTLNPVADCCSLPLAGWLTAKRRPAEHVTVVRLIFITAFL